MLIASCIVFLSNFVSFILFLLIFWLSPGLILLPKKMISKSLDRILLAISFGFCLYSVVIFIIKLTNLSFWIGYIPFILLFVTNLKKLNINKITISRISNPIIFLMVIIFAGSLIQGIVLTKSALRDNQGLRFLEISAHDSLQHVYLINELKENFPPRNPGFAPMLVKNYHFLIDITIASMGKYLPFSTYELYYRVYPTFISVLLGVSVFVFARSLLSSDWLANSAVFLTYFSGNAAWIVKLFRKDQFQVSANNFMLDPIIDLLQNLSAVIVFPLLLAGIIGLMQLEKKKNFRWVVFSSIIFGSLIGFKTWGGTLVILALPVYALILSLKNKNHLGWSVLAITLIMTLILFFPVYDRSSAANPVFAPGWLLKRMVEDPDRLNLQKYYFLEEHYRQTNNTLRIIYINLIETLMYLIGNLWVKSIGIIYLVHMLKKFTASRVFMSLLVLLSLLLPITFNQGRKAYDIIQFGTYALLLMSIFTAGTFQIISKYFSQKITITIVILTLILSFPSNYKSIKSRFISDQLIITNQELETYNYIQNHTSKESILMVYPSKINDAVLLVAALTKRPTYFSGKSFPEITGENINERKEKWKIFFEHTDYQKRKQVIEEGAIDYLLLTNQEDEKFLPAGLNLDQIYQNNKLVLYKIQ